VWFFSRGGLSKNQGGAILHFFHCISSMITMTIEYIHTYTTTLQCNLCNSFSIKSQLLDLYRGIAHSIGEDSILYYNAVINDMSGTGVCGLHSSPIYYRVLEYGCRPVYYRGLGMSVTNTGLVAWLRWVWGRALEKVCKQWLFHSNILFGGVRTADPRHMEPMRGVALGYTRYKAKCKNVFESTTTDRGGWTWIWSYVYCFMVFVSILFWEWSLDTECDRGGSIQPCPLPTARCQIRKYREVEKQGWGSRFHRCFAVRSRLTTT